MSIVPPQPPTYLPLTLGQGLRLAAARDPGKVAVAMGERAITYAQLIDRIDRLSCAAADGLGLQPGDHVALLAANCPEIIEVVCALSSIGVATALINPRLTAPEIEFICNDSEARVLFVDAGLEERAQAIRCDSIQRIVTIGADYEALLAAAATRPPQVPVVEWDVFAMHYTAGTTGKPKGVLLPHRSRVLTFCAMAAEYGCYGPDDRALAIAPMFHGAGFAFAMAPIFFGGFVEILPAFEPEAALTKLATLDISNTFMVPTHFSALFSLEPTILQRLRPRALRTIVSNAAPLSQVLKERIVEYFGETILHETYGSTENGIISNLRPRDQLRKEQCVGLPFPFTEIRLLDPQGDEVPAGEVGEVFTRSPYLFNGYWKRDQANAEALRNGWLSVGDMGRRDDEGYLYLVDRKQDVVISGGVNVYPREIEEWLLRHAAVAETAVVGVADDYWGETVKAFVVLRPGESADARSILKHCESHLAGYKRPKRIEFLNTLPRNAAGKVLKRELRERRDGG